MYCQIRDVCILNAQIALPNLIGAAAIYATLEHIAICGDGLLDYFRVGQREGNIGMAVGCDSSRLVSILMFNLDADCSCAVSFVKHAFWVPLYFFDGELCFSNFLAYEGDVAKSIFYNYLLEVLCRVGFFFNSSLKARGHQCEN